MGSRCSRIKTVYHPLHEMFQFSALCSDLLNFDDSMHVTDTMPLQAREASYGAVTCCRSEGTNDDKES